MIVFFSLFLPLVGGNERGPPIVIEGQDEVVDLDTFFPQTFSIGWWRKGIHFFYQSHIFITSKVVVLMLDNFSLFKKIYKQSKPGPIIILPGQKLTQSVLSCKYS